SLALYAASLRGGKPRLLLDDAAQPFAAPDGLYFLARRGASNVLSRRPLGLARTHAETSNTITDVREFAVTDHEIAVIPKDSETVLLASDLQSQPEPVDDPGTSLVDQISAGSQVLAFNHEDVGLAVDLRSNTATTLSAREANNRVSAAGCFLQWVTGPGA